MISVVSKNNLLCYVVDTSKFEHINEMKQILVGFAEKIDIINMNNIPMQHTIELMKNKNQLQQKVVEFIKNADLYMDNFEYVDMDKIQLKMVKVMKSQMRKCLIFRRTLWIKLDWYPHIKESMYQV